MTNKLFYGDNLDILRERAATESVDLVYLDPPFNSNANYNILFKSKTGDGSDAQMTAFEDAGTGTRPPRSPSTRSCSPASQAPPRCSAPCAASSARTT